MSRACKWGGCDGQVPDHGGRCDRCGHLTTFSLGHTEYPFEVRGRAFMIKASGIVEYALFKDVKGKMEFMQPGDPIWAVHGVKEGYERGFKYLKGRT